MQQMMIPVNGKQLYVEILGPETAPALLYLHGGPGQGSYEFMVHQGGRLSQHLRVVGLDQRGVQRSEPLEPGDPFSLAMLIEDCEAVRQALGIRRWAVLGQSFGGYLALLYALTYPASVERLLFENPTWDLGLTCRSVLAGAAELFRARGDEALAAECLCEDQTGDTVAAWQRFSRMLDQLGEDRARLYFHQPEALERFGQVASAAPFASEWGARGGEYQRRLYAEGALWRSLLPRMAGVRCPALLLKGAHDRIPSPQEVQAFLERVDGAAIELFTESAHFVQVEEPERYGRTVVQFVTGEVPARSTSLSAQP